MKSSTLRIFIHTVMTVAALCTVTPGQARDQILLDNQWRFHLGDVVGAQRESFKDRKWRTVSLPHDWSIEGKTDSDAAAGGGGGFFPTGIGCYRKTFSAPESWRDERVSIEFEGAYQHSEVWINGQLLGTHPYGYTPFHYDLTSHLKIGSMNTLFVRVDNSQQPNSRWYTGSGIYRHVWLHVTNPIHIASRGVFVSTPEVSANEATIKVQGTIHNQSETSRSMIVKVEVIDPAGRSAAMARVEGSIQPNEEFPAQLNITIPHPTLWSPDTPALYTAITRVFIGEDLTDEIRTAFGIRTVTVSAERGFELNGKTVKLVGGNVHHDNGPLGTAALDRAEERKVEILKTAGFNTIRTAHNPPSTAFLAACDRLGMLVIDEAFDGWAKKKTRHDYSTVFHDQWQSDLDAMVLRDRNHPSVVMWSIGNEVYERGDAQGAQIAQAMRERIRNLDTTRPITAGINGMGKPEEWPRLDPLFTSLDVTGYNYEETRHADDHARLPSRVIALSESYQNNTFGCWDVVNDYPYVIGDFVWSGLDYLGEAAIGKVFPPGEKAIPHWEGNHYPWHGAACGDIDITGWRKPISHYRNIVWNRGEKLYATVLAPSPTGEPWSLSKWSMPPSQPSWTWPGQEGEPLQVEVYSRYDSVRLYLNGHLIGEKPTTREQQFKALFDVTYEPGILQMVGIQNYVTIETFALSTAGEAAKLHLAADQSTIQGDGQDLVFVTVEVVDQEGRLCPDADHLIRYKVSGPAVISGIGSGDLTSLDSYQTNPRRVFQGRAVVILRSTGKPGRITLRATAPRLRNSKTILQAK